MVARGRQRFRNKGRHRRPIVSLQLASQAAILTIAFTAAGRTEDAVSKHDLQAKMTYCKTCHGSSGQGFRAY
jgi:cytochrome c553